MALAPLFSSVDPAESPADLAALSPTVTRLVVKRDSLSQIQVIELRAIAFSCQTPPILILEKAPSQE